MIFEQKFERNFGLDNRLSNHRQSSSTVHRFSTNQAARKLGIHTDTLAHYVAVGKVPTPEVVTVGRGKRVVHAWTEEEIENVRKLLPKIANGRKIRYQKLREKQGTQAGAPALPKTKKQKKK